ncbi:hypothetical protein M433DRAFT_108626 [Acidomyces richmondensis BFW]|nr:MAG: hypothetical protein FE78DRAFT_108041 [Acidomyces sp. 'richmondensis']KYG45236.1 hypothetical protein M433DRAFT_108626 [Acidomyces richmondensis BFW]
MKKREPGTYKEHRLPLIGYLPNRIRNHFIAMCGEFIGTFLFLFFGFSSTQVANAAANGANSSTGGLSQVPNASSLLYISLAFGFSLAVNAWVFFRISGGLFNPAVTFGMALVGAINWIRAGLIFISQLLGSMAAAGVVSALFPGPMNVSTTKGYHVSTAQALFIEMFLTAELVFTIFMLAAEKHKGTFLAPIGIGLALFIAELSGVYFTGGSLNPARSFGPCVVLHYFPPYHWIYWLGPALGAILAAGFYRFVKILEYETANPGQDFNEKEAEVFVHDEDNAATGADVARPVVHMPRPDYSAGEAGPQASNESVSYPATGVSPQASGSRDGVNGNGFGKTPIESPANNSAGPSAAVTSFRSGPAVESGSRS